MTVLWESPSRIVRCSKYNGRTAGTGAAAVARAVGASSAPVSRTPMRQAAGAIATASIGTAIDYCWAGMLGAPL